MMKIAWLPLVSIVFAATQLAATTDSFASSGVEGAHADSFVRVDPKTQHFVDSSGRVHIYRGLNVMRKVDPFFPDTEGFDPFNSFSEEDMEFMQQWGFNSIRLGVYWPGVEPEEGVFNSTYLSIVEDTVNKAGEYGIKTIIDLHQDALSPKFCGNGMPDWLIEHCPWSMPFPFPLPFHFDHEPDTQYPQPSQCHTHPWAQYHFATATASAFEYVLSDGGGFLSRYWDVVSKRFSGNPNVLGYELFNEPFAGDVFAHPTRLWPGVADKQLLQPLYETLHRVIRQNDDEHLIFFEPITWDYLPVGFDRSPGGDAFRNRSALAYHLYCVTVDETKTSAIAHLECEAQDQIVMGQRMSDLQRLGVGGFLTEFGAIGNSSVGTKEVEFVTAMADRHLQSWSYWKYKTNDEPMVEPATHDLGLFDGEGELEVNKLKLLSRTYARVTAGLPTYMEFDPETGRFQLNIEINQVALEAPTEIFLNEGLHYPSGVEVEVVPQSLATWSRARQNVILLQVSSNANVGDVLAVVINRKKSGM